MFTLMISTGQVLLLDYSHHTGSMLIAIRIRSDVAGTYDLDFGQAMPYQRPPRAKERNFWGDIENVGKDVLDAATGSADFSKTVNFPMDIGQQGQRTNIYTDDE